jgi:cell division septum initiation protein DivIVA
MNSSLDAVERKLDQLLTIMHGLRAENEKLRLRAASLESEKTILSSKISAARERLEALRDRLPEA